jgi:hypothetical protein
LPYGGKYAFHHSLLTHNLQNSILIIYTSKDKYIHINLIIYSKSASRE